jgi:O-antigen/teichoic acid export membrane protein
MASSVVSRVAGLGALTAAGQLLIIGSLPAYSRIFDPGVYGEYVIFVGAFTVVSVLAGLRYDSAIVLPRSESVAAALSSLVLLIGLGVAAAIAVLSLAAGHPGSPTYWAYVGSSFGYGLAAATAVGTLQRCLTSWCVRGGRFLLMGCGQFAFCLGSVVAQLLLARHLAQLSALIWGYVCALSVQTAVLAGAGWHGWTAASSAALSIRWMRFVARKYRRFPVYMVGYALASSVRDRLIQAVLGIGAGAAVVGRFGLAYRVVFAPNSLVYSAVSPVFYGIASRGSRSNVGRFAAGLAETAFVTLVVPYTAFAVEAPALTDAVLSPKWRGTGPYLQALAAPALLLAATCWLDRAFDSFRRQNVAFKLEACFTLISVVAVASLSQLLEPVAVARIFAALALAYYWLYFLCTFVACGFPLPDFRRACAGAALSMCLALPLCIALHEIPAPSMRFPAYALAMVAVIAVWIRFRGGADILRLLLRSRVAAPWGASTS